MLSRNQFSSTYRALEVRMRALAESDGDVFLPNPTPLVPVDYVFICMEPSLGRRARTKEEAVARVEAGFHNFLSSWEDFILHFAASNYLCRPGQEYHVTDLSKGAMLVRDANVERAERYDRWYPLLLEELRLIARPETKVFAVGRAVSIHLERRSFPMDYSRIIHYSGQAASARKACIAGREQEFEVFKKQVTRDDILLNAERVLEKAQIVPHVRSTTLKNLSRGDLTESRLRLLLCYKLSFGQLRLGQVDQG